MHGFFFAGACVTTTHTWCRSGLRNGRGGLRRGLVLPAVACRIGVPNGRGGLRSGRGGLRSGPRGGTVRRRVRV